MTSLISRLLGGNWYPAFAAAGNSSPSQGIQIKGKGENSISSPELIWQNVQKNKTLCINQGTQTEVLKEHLAGKTFSSFNNSLDNTLSLSELEIKKRVDSPSLCRKVICEIFKIIQYSFLIGTLSFAIYYSYSFWIEYATFQNQLAQIAEQCPNIKADSLGTLPVKEMPFVRLEDIEFKQNITNIFASGEYSYETIGHGITKSSFVTDYSGNPWAILKAKAPYDEFARSIFSKSEPGLAPAVASMPIGGGVFKVIQYIQGIHEPIASVLMSGMDSLYKKCSKFIEDRQIIAVFDHIFCNTDRHYQNILITEQGLVAIDHDQIFSPAVGLVQAGLTKLVRETPLSQRVVNFVKSLDLDYISDFIKNVYKYDGDFYEGFEFEKKAYLRFDTWNLFPEGADRFIPIRERLALLIRAVIKRLQYKASTYINLFQLLH